MTRHSKVPGRGSPQGSSGDTFGNKIKPLTEQRSKSKQGRGEEVWDGGLK